MLSNSCVLHKAGELSHGARKIKQVQGEEAGEWNQHRHWFSFYKCLLRSESLLPSLNLKYSVQVFLYSLVHYSATENTPTVTGLALWVLGVCLLFFNNLGFLFNQLDFSLSPAKEAEENPEHHFCDLCRWK